MSDFELNTEKRSEQRSEWETYKHTKEMEIAIQKESAERRQNEEADREVWRMRQEAVHKANPVKKFKNVEVHPSDKALTLPMTPRFSERLKQRSVRM